MWLACTRLFSIVMVVAISGCMEAKEAPKPPTDSNVMAISRNSNQLAFDLYAQLSEENDGNLFFSPQSISTALAMTYAGAKGETADQMASVLHFNLPADKLHPAQAALLNYLNSLGNQGDVQLSVANRLWRQQGYKFLDSFTKLLRKDYGAGLEQLDFADSEAARKTINDWVSESTAGKVEDLIPSGVLNSLTRLVLTNAVYFKGDWEHAFRESATRPSDFHLSSADKIDNVPLMRQKETFLFGEAKLENEQGMKLLEMPYKGKQLSMIVLLPDEMDGLRDLESQLTSDNVQQWLDTAKLREVSVWLPKFKMTGEFQLNAILSALGMTAAFDSHNADFSGMDGNRDLFLSAVIHKSYVDVNESGTEAAAATGVVVTARAAAPTKTPTFRADHPFVFLIRENETGAILFAGRVVDPR